MAAAVAAALAGSALVDVTEAEVRPHLAAALGCEAPVVSTLVTVWELPGTAAWALASCGGADRLVVFAAGDTPGTASAAWPVELGSAAPAVHGFVDLGRTRLHLEKVGQEIRLSAGPHGQVRPALVVTTGGSPRRLVLLRLGAEAPVVLLDAEVEGAAFSVFGADPTPRIEVQRGDDLQVVPL
ncbi:MAG: hypothetical protein ACI8PZ_003425 [Myxococcota bacterium]|jgi:hypothetical protein